MESSNRRVAPGAGPRVACLAAALLSLSGLRAATLIVAPDKSGDFTEIQPAIDAAADGDIVVVLPGEYLVKRPLEFRTGAALEGKARARAITVESQAGPERTVVRLSSEPDDSLTASVVLFQPGTGRETVLRGITVTGGRGTRRGSRNDGGGILCTRASPTLEDLVIEENAAGRGGGIACLEGSSPSLTRCVIRKNHTGDDIFGTGGGVYCNDGSSPVLTECVIAENYASHGGGIFCVFASSPRLLDSAILRNEALNAGGGTYFNEDTEPVMVGCRVSENRAFAGAGVDVLCARPLLTGCSITENRAIQVGGGIRSVNSSPVVRHVTVAGNSAGSGGSGIYISADPTFCEDLGTATLESSIVWDNPCEAVVVVAQSGASLEASYSCIQGHEVWPGIGNILQDPEFCGWPRSEVYVDASYQGPSDGTAARPYRDLEAALAYDLELKARSPCRGSGKVGSDMGAGSEQCRSEGSHALRVRVAPGEYGLSGRTLARHVSIEGSGHDRTVLLGTVFGLRSGAVLEDVTVTGGTTGGVHVCGGEAPEILRCSITKNVSYDDGGGLVCTEGAAPVLEDCVISANTAGSVALPEYGGGVYCDGASDPVLVRCAITGNTGTSAGGGIALFGDSRARLTECDVSGNTSPLGGGIFAYGASAFLEQSVISANIASSLDHRTAGGIRARGSTLGLRNCRVTANRELGSIFNSAGGIAAEGSRVELVHCNVTGNRSSQGTGGVFVEGPSALVVRNSIVWGNLGGLLESVRVGPGASDDFSFSCVEGPALWDGPGNIRDDPLFLEPHEWDDGGTPRDLADDVFVPGDEHLISGSPCIDAAAEDDKLAVDLEGSLRPCGQGADMGAYESDCPEEPKFRFVRGNCNGEGGFHPLADAIFLLLYKFSGGGKPGCMAACDADGNGQVELTDAIYALLYGFLGGPAPPPPFPACGGPGRPTDVLLACAVEGETCR